MHLVKLKITELAACKKAGVNQVIEIKVGYDGIVFASNSKKAAYKLRPQHVFAALAAEVAFTRQIGSKPLYTLESN